MSRAYTEAEARELFLLRIAAMMQVRFHDQPERARERAASLVGDILSIIDGCANDLPGIDLMLRPYGTRFVGGLIINEDNSQIVMAKEWRKYARKEVEA